ncbi:MAG: YfcE family phosphodiesterase [Burkholderiales bacterium]|nr:MAG: YfcE family phosphodiesterase [Burkholderiales bacterium]
MKIAILSDIHGNLSALKAVVEDIARRGGVDEVINLGNMVSGPLMPLQTAHFLMQQDWLQVAGNHDPQVLQVTTGVRSSSDAFAAAELDDPARWWLTSLHDSLDPRLHNGELWAERLGGAVAGCHGTPRSTIEYLLETAEGEGVRMALSHEIAERLGDHMPPHVQLLVCGHTHVQRALRLPGGLLVVNPGAVGMPAYDVSRAHPLSNYHRVENGSPDARYAVAEQVSGVWQAELISVPYDFESAARLAIKNGRPDWAHALRTGYMPRLLTMT